MGKVDFIAEIGSNHNKSLRRCYKLIDAAKDIGATGVKFQLFELEKLYSKDAKKLYKKLSKRLKTRELPKKFIPKISRYCKKKQIKFGCTPFDIDSAEYLINYVDFLKIASYELIWDDLIKKCSQFKKRIILSTGASNMREITKIAKKYSLAIIEDAADSLGSKYKNKHTGTFGKIGVLSFNGNKTITSGSGGAIITNEKKIFLRAKHLISISKKNHAYEFIHDEVGWNYRMNNLNASLGLSQIKKLKKILKLKKKIADNYKRAFRNNKYCQIVSLERNVELNNWINLLKLKDRYNKKKDKLLNFLVKKGYFCRAVWRPMHLLPHLKNYQRSEMKNTIKLYRNTICLPSSANLFK